MLRGLIFVVLAVVAALSGPAVADQSSQALDSPQGQDNPNPGKHSGLLEQISRAQPMELPRAREPGPPRT